MADRITEPANANPVTVDWQNLLNKLTKIAGAFLQVDFVEDGINAPKVKNGSRFEINGSFFEVSGGDEDISGYEAIPDGTNAYIYAIPNQPNPGEASVCTFEYDTTVPIYDVVLGGMFNGVNRCLGMIEKIGEEEYSLWNALLISSRDSFISGIWHIPTPDLPM